MADRLLPRDAALDRLRTLHAKSIDLTLGRVHRLLDALGRPQDRLPPTIHVAGTNGKGSTVAFLRSIAEAAGLSVHAFTSPHLVRFAERIRLNGALITDEALAELIDRVEAANAGGEITFFEITTCAALQAFAATPADLLVLEVGLGGTWDATNVLDAPLASVIAPVDLDHREFLGDTIAQIARDKAGIIKPGRPAFSARQSPDAEREIAARAHAVGAPLFVMGRDFDPRAEGGRLVFEDARGRLDLPLPALGGPHQIANAGLAIGALRELFDFRETAFARGVEGASWPARLQRLAAGPLAERAAAAAAELLLDGGHNPHAARALSEAMRERGADGRPLVLITGLLANKDAAGFFGPFAPLRPRVFTVPIEAERVHAPQALTDAACAAGLQAEPCASAEEALSRALASADRPRVLICGSLYLAGEVLARSPDTWPT